ncbi:MAG: DUF4924 family protein [Paludibacteraceae bacterium]|nr:DUF4924 family protein [Paludibacteraceae bacterium]
MFSKKNNIAEYILHLWQIEDYLRAFPEQADKSKELREISEMMHAEGIIEKGHLQLAQIALREMEELHDQLVNTDAIYRAAAMQLAPKLAILKSKSDNENQSDLSMIFVFMYSIMLLNLQKKELSDETLLLKKQAGQLLTYLSRCYRDEKNSN